MTLPRAVLRFAPSPNGRLHLGHAYSALLNALCAERLGGRLLLRIEDLDASRCKPEFEAALIGDLAWLGLRFEPGPRRQSEHGADYAAALDRLKGQGLAYPCLCSRADVAALANGAYDPDGAPRHAARACRCDAVETARRMEAGAVPAWRLDMTTAVARVGDRQEWTEFFEGEAAVARAGSALAWGDVLLTGAARAASYHLAVVVDDALQGVSDVVRGRDLLEATAVHRVLQRLLRLPAPRYRHHRLVLGESGAKLSKSARAPSIASLREAGATPADIVDKLGLGRGPASVVFGEEAGLR